MEEIYRPENYGASSRFPLKRYFEDFNKSLSSDIPISNFYEGEESEVKYLEAIKDLMDVDLYLNELNNLSESCRLSLLNCEGENTKDFPIEISDNLNSSSKLPCAYITSSGISNPLEVNKCKTDLEKKKSAFELSLGNKRNYHKRLEFTTPPIPPDVRPGSDFILSILIYRPFAFKYFCAKNASDRLKFSHEILALGNNTLAELRDTIICSSDDGLCKEVESTSEDLKSLADAKSKYPSGFIFIDNVFYNDLRSPNSLDYSLPIMEWAKEKKIKDLQSTSIEDVRLHNLTPRFGYPYLYMHQGDCEHLLVFADVRLLGQDDCLHSQCYPHVLKLNQKANRMCFLCTVSFAKWICVDSDRFPQNKVFLCTDCCNAYNYVDGKKVGNFKLYPYFEKHVTDVS